MVRKRAARMMTSAPSSRATLASIPNTRRSPSCVSTASGGPEATTRPASKSTTLSAKRAARPRSCMTATTVAPARARARSTPSTRSWWRGSRAATGSSATENWRLDRERAGEQRAAALAAGELGGRTGLEAFEPRRRDRFGDGAPPLLGERVDGLAMRQATQGHDGFDGERPGDDAALRQVGEGAGATGAAHRVHGFVPCRDPPRSGAKVPPGRAAAWSCRRRSDRRLRSDGRARRSGRCRRAPHASRAGREGRTG